LASLDVLGEHELMYRADGHSLLRAPTPEQPLRIYVGGDSLSGTPAIALGNTARRNALIEVIGDTRTSSGLVADWFFDWPVHMSERVSPQPYDVIVMMMGGNDAQRFRASGGALGSEEWVGDYRERMETVRRSARACGRLVVWIGLPPVTPSNIETIVPHVNATAASLADELANVVYLDAFSMFADEDGGFARYLDDENGKRVMVRAGDGVHFANIAGDWLSDQILDIVQANIDSGIDIRAS
jgi:hypothetical protein